MTPDDSASVDTEEQETPLDGAADHEPDVEAAMSDAEAQSGGRAPLFGRRTLTALAVVFGILCIVLALLLASALNDKNDTDALSDDRQEAAETAGRFSESFLTFDYQNLDETKESVLEHATGAFQNEYEEAFAGLQELWRQTRAAQQATVKGVFVGEIDEESAEVITVSDANLTGVSGTRPILNVYMQLDLVKVGERWKIGSVTSLNFNQTANSGNAEQDPGATSTTAPGSAPTSTPPGEQGGAPAG